MPCKPSIDGAECEHLEYGQAAQSADRHGTRSTERAAAKSAGEGRRRANSTSAYVHHAGLDDN